MKNDNAGSVKMAKLSRCIRLALTGFGASALSMSALAQAAGDDAVRRDEATRNSDDDVMVVDEVVVTGVRSSLQSSQALKRDSDVFVDAVTANDIGSLPDRSITEVLQRVPGVSISRFAGADDPDHFSVEGSGTVVRGIGFVRSEINGRDVFSADAGQALGFQNVSPELMQSVQVFKNQSADLIEGGIGGTVNLVTRKPFDQKEGGLSFSTESNYSDFKERWSPTLSALWSDRWALSDGSEFGAMVAGAYSELNSRADGTLVADWLDRDGTGQFTPSGGGIRTQNFDRQRSGVSAALQWASADDRIEATTQFFHSAYDNAWNEFAIEPSIDDGPGIIPLDGTSFQFGAGGLFESGIITENVGWRSNDAALPLNGVRNLALRRQRLEEPVTNEYSLNVQYAPTDRIRTQFDVQHVRSKAEVADYTVHNAFFADTQLDVTGDVPQVTLLSPTDTAEGYVQSEEAFYTRSIMDHLQDNEGDETAVRGDLEFDFSGDSWAKSVRFGGRYAERDQTVRYSTFNWGNMSATWNDPLRISEANAPEGLYAQHNFENYQRGEAPDVNGAYFYAGEFNAQALRDLAALTTVSSWIPLEDRAGVVPGTPFLPGEINVAQQETTAAYVRFDFGGDFSNGMSLDGNVGVRYVSTDQRADGGINFPSVQQFLDNDPDLTARCTPQTLGDATPGFCSLDPATQVAYLNWADGASTTINDAYDYDNVLPSLNMKLGLNDDMLIRFGLSRAISRPDFGLLKSFFTINFGQDDPVTGEFLGPTANTAEVRLDPIVANQVDLSYEWYFSDVGSLTVTGFFKELEDYIVPSTSVREFTTNGETFAVSVNGVGNSDETGRVRGVELAYQQTFDQLPGLWRHLGVQANATFISSSGVPNIGANNTSADGTSTAPNFDVSQLGLPGLSDRTYNLVTFWENDTVSARLAYNYRSDFTLTVRDVIFPFTPIVHASTSQLDGSIFYKFTDQLELGLQGVNLLDEVIETRAVLDANGTQAPRSFFRNDRRYALILRGRW
ncbi:MAG: TonB-dependent receptor [Gammaproteobacteria bacterium]